MCKIISSLIIFVFIATSLYADTVIMKDRKRIKGLVIDEYVDRIKLNTVNGERNIFREDIERIEYDTPEQNFMQLGRAYDTKGLYDKATFYYKKAMEVNPDYKEARESYLASHAKMWRQEEKRTRKELQWQSMVKDWWKNRNKKTTFLPQDKKLLLKKILGISLVETDGIFTIDEVLAHSTAAKAGIQKDDMLAGIWGKLIRYSKMEEIVNELIGPKHSEVRILVEKKIPVSIDGSEKDLYKELGILLSFEYEGLIIKDIVTGERGESTGFKKGDLVVAIDKTVTRYFPLDSVIALINSAKNNREVVFIVRRNITLRREADDVK